MQINLARDRADKLEHNENEILGLRRTNRLKHDPCVYYYKNDL